MHNFIKPAGFTTIVRSILLLITCTFSHTAFALEFECTSGTDKRYIRLELPGIDHLCEVSVTYTNDERKVMWYADHDSKFCSDKTTELQQKYQNKWGFECEQWPDHDGVDQLSARQRTILDAELKFLIEQGQSQNTPYLVEGLKAAASPSDVDDSNLLVVQFFLHEPTSNTRRDVTHIIRDNGASWSTMSRINTLANYIDANEGYIVNSALISTVTDNGAMEVITLLDLENSSSESSNNPSTTGCYGNQTLAAQNDGQLIARTPHRYFCPESASGDAG